jgi:hypothetical protein
MFTCTANFAVKKYSCERRFGTSLVHWLLKAIFNAFKKTA